MTSPRRPFRLHRLLLCALLVSAQAAGAQENAAPTVTTAVAVDSAITLKVIASGSLLARENVSVYPRISGLEITELLVDVGDTVAKGQLMAHLNEETLTARLQEADANLAIARAAIEQTEAQLRSAEAGAWQTKMALERTTALSARGERAQATLDDAVAASASANAGVASAKAAISSARAQVAQAEAAQRIAALNLSWAEIRSPVDGLVVERSASLGDLSSGSAEMFRLIRDGVIELRAEVVESDLVDLHEGDAASVSVSGLGARSGTVRLIEPLVDPATRLGTIRIAIEDQQDLRAGLFAQARVDAGTRTAVTVPASTVLTSGSGQYVQTVVDGVVRQTPVTAGVLVDGQREIVEGLAAGDQVLLRAGAFFRDGDKVTPVAQEGASK